MGKGKIVYRLREKDLPFLRSEDGRTFFKDYEREILWNKMPPFGPGVIVVGDASALRIPPGRIYSLFYDGKTKRKEISKKERRYLDKLNKSGGWERLGGSIGPNRYVLPFKEMTVRNDPGTISMELWKAARAALSDPTKVFVEGEEDLATLALIAQGQRVPIVYGIPGKGMCFVLSDSRMKAKARRMLGLAPKRKRKK
jgi:uncharacterized protein (UPF0218 family)